jgi:glycosyltransferase involved in cell wall biosynthesis
LDILFSGAVFHPEWKGGEPVIGKELIRFLSERHNCRICKSLPFTVDKTRSLLRFVEKDNFVISSAINRANISKADIVLTFYDFDTSIMRECIKKQVPIVATQHIYWGLCPKFDFWNNTRNCSCSKIEPQSRDCKECISKQSSLGPRLTASLFSKKIINNLRSNRKLIFSKCNAIVVPSNFMAKLYKKELGNVDVRAVHNGINTKFYRPGKSDSKRTKKQILYAGARTNVKGYHHFVKLASDVSKLRNDVEFVAFGYGQGFTHNYVRDLGYLSKSDVPTAYSNGYALIFPALWDEPFAQIPLESMACGCPVIAYAAGGVSEMILNDHNGNLVSTGDYDQLLKTTIDLIDNPSKAEQMRLTSRRYIEENFGLETMLSSYEKIITEITK